MFNGRECPLNILLELHSNGQRGISRDGEGKIKAEGFRHVAYSTFPLI